jgi:hypothetical protein
VGAPQVGARLHAELVDQLGADRGVGPQRLGLAASPVQRQDETAPQVFPVGVLDQQPAQLGDRPGVVAALDPLADQLFGGAQPYLVERFEAAVPERAARQVGQRCPAPERERVGETGLRDQLLERQQVQRAVRYVDGVAGAVAAQVLGTEVCP